MNRAERRHPPKEVKVINRAVAGMVIDTAFRCASNEPLTDDQRNTMLAPFAANLERLRKGQLDAQGYYHLSEANATAYCLALELYKLATPESKLIIDQSALPIEEAAQALMSIAYRYRDTGKYGANAAELISLRESFTWMDQLLNIANTGDMYRALRASAVMLKQVEYGVKKGKANG